MLNLIPSGPPGIPASRLRERLEEEGFGVTKRTVERDLNLLSAAVPLACNDRSAPFGWYFPKEVDFGLAEPDLADALSLHMTEDFLRQSLPPAFLANLETKFRRARDRLKANPKAPQSRWRSKVRNILPTLHTLPPKLDPEVLREVQNALLNERCIEADYQPIDRTETIRLLIHPLGLIQRGHVTYLIGTAFDYDDIRQYALHRMARAEPTASKRRLPKGFTLDRYLASGAMGFGHPKPIQLEATIVPALASHLTETPLGKDQALDPVGDNFRLRVTIDDTWQLQWWILSQGPQITIESPTELRHRIASSLREAAANYAD